MKQFTIIPLLLVLACSSDEGPKTTSTPTMCPDGKCSGGENPRSCPEDCGDPNFTVPTFESGEVEKILLLAPGGKQAKAVNVIDNLEAQQSCVLLQDGQLSDHGWHSGYFPTRYPTTRLQPFWSYPSNCPLTEDPNDYTGRKARIRFELKFDGHYNINMWVPRLIEMCASEYDSDNPRDTEPMMTYIHAALKINSDTPTPKLIKTKFFVKINTTKEGVLRNIFENQPLEKGEHELWVFDHSPNATQCPSTGQNSTPEDEIFFVDGLYIEYLKPIEK